MRRSNGRFHLCGIVNHVGRSVHSGHYTACIRNEDDDEWIFFDDDVGKVMSFEEIAVSKGDQCYLALYEWREESESCVDTTHLYSVERLAF